jgi:hypothetical protein
MASPLRYESSRAILKMDVYLYFFFRGPAAKKEVQNKSTFLGIPVGVALAVWRSARQREKNPTWAAIR